MSKRCRLVFVVILGAMVGCVRGSGEPARACRLPWSLDGEMVCEGDLIELSKTLQGVQAREIRPGAIYVRQADQLQAVGLMDTRWLRDLRVPVWIHGDQTSRLRALYGLGSARLRSWKRLCDPACCCDPSWIRGIGPKTVKRWAGQAVIDRDAMPCLFWEQGAMSLGPCWPGVRPDWP